MENDNAPASSTRVGRSFNFYTDPYLFSKLQTENTSSGDPFTIHNIQRIGNTLKILVSYSGGCANHSFDIIWDGTVNLSTPEKVDIFVSHDAADDTCEALISKTLEINVDMYFNNLINDNTIFTVYNASNGQYVQLTSGKMK